MTVITNTNHSVERTTAQRGAHLSAITIAARDMKRRNGGHFPTPSEPLPFALRSPSTVRAMSCASFGAALLLNEIESTGGISGLRPTLSDIESAFRGRRRCEPTADLLSEISTGVHLRPVVAERAQAATRNISIAPNQRRDILSAITIAARDMRRRNGGSFPQEPAADRLSWQQQRPATARQLLLDEITASGGGNNLRRIPPVQQQQQRQEQELTARQLMLDAITASGAGNNLRRTPPIQQQRRQAPTARQLMLDAITASGAGNLRRTPPVQQQQRTATELLLAEIAAVNGVNRLRRTPQEPADEQQQEQRQLPTLARALLNELQLFHDDWVLLDGDQDGDDF